MRAETQAIVDSINQCLDLVRRHFDWDVAQKRLAELNEKAESADLWNDAAKAQALLRERTQLERALGGYTTLKAELDDALALLELGEAEKDQASIGEAEAMLAALKPKAEKKQLESLLSGEADGNDCYLEVHAGAGGTEAQDWAQMLMRMYTRWADQHGYKTEWLEESGGEEAGIKSASIKVTGPNAYGWLKTETGVHRLVRISPFDSNARRHTSFSSVGVYPVIDENIEVEVLDKDLKIDTFRASGAGGQHVNKTESAIRITHVPTGIIVSCQVDRSQHRNRAMAMQMLKARLYEVELKKREAAAQARHDSKTDIGWGHQIRSYVLQPYQIVKDLRTGVERGNAQAVLDGELDPFLEAALAQKVGGEATEPATA
ncbi:MAG: peptide chain release factor 2 [Polyangiaceae bacterium]|nr:peptide chain release factor 2 [Polyangiaceae bacterium]